MVTPCLHDFSNCQDCPSLIHQCQQSVLHLDSRLGQAHPPKVSQAITAGSREFPLRISNAEVWSTLLLTLFNNFSTELSGRSPQFAGFCVSDSMKLHFFICQLTPDHVVPNPACSSSNFSSPATTQLAPCFTHFDMNNSTCTSSYDTTQNY